MRCKSVLLAALLFPAAAAAQARSTLQPLSFMSGCWRGPAGNQTIEEVYTTPTRNLMQGMTRYLRNDSVVDYEFTLIEASRTGSVLKPQPKGQAPTTFASKESTASRVVWENPAHDFPQRVIYQRTGTDSLVARIEGGGRAMEWRMGRVRCPGS
jgi:hypothetical protein